MHILFYRYNNIFEPQMKSAFREFGITVIEDRTAMQKPAPSPGACARAVAERILESRQTQAPFLFVFSINFHPAVSEVCEKLDVLYVCWSVDCPVMELFYNSVRNSHNRIFLFDRVQYERFAPYNPSNIHYLPLCGNAEGFAPVTAALTREDRQRFGGDISFVGSLYTELNTLDRMELSDPYVLGYIDALIDAQLQVFGYNFIEEALTDPIVEALKGSPIDREPKDFVESIDRYTAAHFLIGMKLAQEERIRTLSAVSEHFDVNLFTGSTTDRLPRVSMRGTVHSTQEMPKVFRLSRINLNITMRPIQSGLPLRIFDVLSSGGFLLTNYQPELPELFEPGTDLETYCSTQELLDKCSYYLSHEDARCRIAASGYEKVAKYHSCRQRTAQLLSAVCGQAVP